MNLFTRTSGLITGDDGEEGGDAPAVVSDLHEAVDRAARNWAYSDSHGSHFEASPGKQGVRETKAAASPAIEVRAAAFRSTPVGRTR